MVVAKAGKAFQGEGARKGHAEGDGVIFVPLTTYLVHDILHQQYLSASECRVERTYLYPCALSVPC